MLIYYSLPAIGMSLAKSLKGTYTVAIAGKFSGEKVWPKLLFLRIWQNSLAKE